MKLISFPGLFFISRHDGAEMTESEAREVLTPMGGLDELWEPTEGERALHKVGHGWFAKARFVGKAKEAVVVSISIQP